ncbi:MAG TPA: cation:proton antiporter [Candidatus Diapherotrites archaeon]|jgi:Kef-type K+ transport system membrane component KefB/voltage-gated potassium channel Kch|nr:cation:proton antiporter [Candidatus Diapherotrites archaeon]
MVQNILISVCIILIFATLIAYIFNKLKQPPLLAYIITGIILGPMVLNIIQNTPDIRLLSEIGVAFLLFTVGINIDFKETKKFNKSIYLVPLINLIFGFLTFLICKNIFGINWIQSLYLSCIISFSSTVVVAKILIDNNEINSLHGKIAMIILLVEDLIAVIIMPLLKDITNFSIGVVGEVLLKVGILIVIAYILYKHIYPKLIKNLFGSQEGFFLLSVASAAIFILLSYLLNFSIAVGAFIGGLAISIFPYNINITHNISGLRNLFSMIFFVSLGLQLTFNFSANYYILLLILFIMIFLFKPIVHFIQIIWAGYGTRIATKISLELTQVSEFSLILAMQGFTLNHITNSQYSAIIVITAISMLITPYIMKYDNKIYNLFKPLFNKLNLENSKYFNRKINEYNNPPKQIKNHIILIGADTLGNAIQKVLAKYKEIPLIIVDYDPEKTKKLINKKINTICGDINFEETINILNIQTAKLAVITIPQFETTIKFLKTAKKINPKIKIYARANTEKEALKLYENGADFVIMPHILETNLLLEKITNLITKHEKESQFSKEMYINYLKEKIEEKNN